MSDAAAAALARRLPQGRVSIDDADRLAASMDLWPRHVLRLREGGTAEIPRAVVWPATLEEVQITIGAARELGLGLVPYAGGSSVVGGATPEPDQVVLDLKRLDRIRAVDTERLFVTCEAGVLGELLDRELGRHGLTVGHFPSSMY